MFQDGSGGGPTDSPQTRGVVDTRARTSRQRLRSSAKQCVRHRTTSDGPKSSDAASVLGPAMCPPRRPVTLCPRGAKLPCRRASDHRRTGRGTRHRRKCTRPTKKRHTESRSCNGSCAPQWAPSGQAEFPGSTPRIHPFASMRFHVLLNSLFKVLFNFPSRYLSAIGLVPVFSLRWSLPPALGCIPKQPDSKEARSHRVSRRKGLTPAMGKATIRRT